jgi:DNA polymerase III sliding clamp (beta) subunit (PCNA family)
LDKAIGRVIHAAAKEPNRPILSTILFEGDEKGFRLVTADNYRIAIADLSTEDHADFGRVPVALDYIPTLRAFLKISKRPVGIVRDGLQLIVRDSFGSVQLRIVDGNYPNYQSVIAFDGAPLGVNPTYVVDAAKATATKGAVRKGDPLMAPFVFEVPGYREAVMPVRFMGEDAA